MATYTITYQHPGHARAIAYASGDWQQASIYAAQLRADGARVIRID